MRFFTAADGTHLAYTDEGVGLPLICLAGLSRTGADFDYLLPHLPPVRLIRPDYRGRGRSGWSGAETYTIPQEAQDVLALMDHLGLNRAAILGTSRGGLIGMVLAATVRDRVIGLCLNDVGPVLDRAGLETIFDYVGRNPGAPDHEAAARAMAKNIRGFEGVPHARWLEEARKHFISSGHGLRITYDPALRDGFVAAYDAPQPDLWPLFDACGGLPLALIRGANSELLSRETADEMARRRPDMIRAEVPGRGHIPYLDEPEAVAAIHDWLGRCQ